MSHLLKPIILKALNKYVERGDEIDVNIGFGVLELDHVILKTEAIVSDFKLALPFRMTVAKAEKIRAEIPVLKFMTSKPLIAEVTGIRLELEWGGDYVTLPDIKQIEEMVKEDIKSKMNSIWEEFRRVANSKPGEKPFVGDDDSDTMSGRIIARIINNARLILHDLTVVIKLNNGKSLTIHLQTLDVYTTDDKFENIWYDADGDRILRKLIKIDDFRIYSVEEGDFMRKMSMIVQMTLDASGTKVPQSPSIDARVVFGSSIGLNVSPELVKLLLKIKDDLDSVTSKIDKMKALVLRNLRKGVDSEVVKLEYAKICSNRWSTNFVPEAISGQQMEIESCLDPETLRDIIYTTMRTQCRQKKNDQATLRNAFENINLSTELLPAPRFPLLTEFDVTFKNAGPLGIELFSDPEKSRLVMNESTGLLKRGMYLVAINGCFVLGKTCEEQSQLLSKARRPTTLRFTKLEEIAGIKARAIIPEIKIHFPLNDERFPSCIGFSGMGVQFEKLISGEMIMEASVMAMKSSFGFGGIQRSPTHLHSDIHIYPLSQQDQHHLSFTCNIIDLHEDSFWRNQFNPQENDPLISRLRFSMFSDLIQLSGKVGSLTFVANESLTHLLTWVNKTFPPSTMEPLPSPPTKRSEGFPICKFDFNLNQFGLQIDTPTTNRDGSFIAPEDSFFKSLAFSISDLSMISNSLENTRKLTQVKFAAKFSSDIPILSLNTKCELSLQESIGVSIIVALSDSKLDQKTFEKLLLSLKLSAYRIPEPSTPLHKTPPSSPLPVNNYTVADAVSSALSTTLGYVPELNEPLKLSSSEALTLFISLSTMKKSIPLDLILENDTMDLLIKEIENPSILPPKSVRLGMLIKDFRVELYSKLEIRIPMICIGATTYPELSARVEIDRLDVTETVSLPASKLISWKEISLSYTQQRKHSLNFPEKEQGFVLLDSSQIKTPETSSIQNADFHVRKLKFRKNIEKVDRDDAHVKIRNLRIRLTYGILEFLSKIGESVGKISIDDLQDDISNPPEPSSPPPSNAIDLIASVHVQRVSIVFDDLTRAYIPRSFKGDRFPETPSLRRAPENIAPQVVSILLVDSTPEDESSAMQESEENCVSMIFLQKGAQKQVETKIMLLSLRLNTREKVENRKHRSGPGRTRTILDPMEFSISVLQNVRESRVVNILRMNFEKPVSFSLWAEEVSTLQDIVAGLSGNQAPSPSPLPVSVSSSHNLGPEKKVTFERHDSNTSIKSEGFFTANGEDLELATREEEKVTTIATIDCKEGVALEIVKRSLSRVSSDAFLPVLLAAVRNVEVKARTESMFAADFAAHCSFQVETSMQNLKLGVWEPLIEPFTVDIHARRTYENHLNIFFSIASRINLNISELNIRLLKRLMDEFTRSMSKRKENQDLTTKATANSNSYMIVNTTGADVVIDDIAQIGCGIPGTLKVEIRDAWSLPSRERWRYEPRIEISVPYTEKSEENQIHDPYKFPESTSTSNVLNPQSSLIPWVKRPIVFSFHYLGTSTGFPILDINAVGDSGEEVNTRVNISTHIIMQRKEGTNEWVVLYQRDIPSCELLLKISFEQDPVVAAKLKREKWTPLSIASGKSQPVSFEGVWSDPTETQLWKRENTQNVMRIASLDFKLFKSRGLEGKYNLKMLLDDSGSYMVDLQGVQVFVKTAMRPGGKRVVQLESPLILKNQTSIPIEVLICQDLKDVAIEESKTSILNSKWNRVNYQETRRSLTSSSRKLNENNNSETGKLVCYETDESPIPFATRQYQIRFLPMPHPKPKKWRLYGKKPTSKSAIDWTLIHEIDRSATFVKPDLEIAASTTHSSLLLDPVEENNEELEKHDVECEEFTLPSMETFVKFRLEVWRPNSAQLGEEPFDFEALHIFEDLNSQWTCVTCGEVNSSAFEFCGLCNDKKPGSSEVETSPVISETISQRSKPISVLKSISSMGTRPFTSQSRNLKQITMITSWEVQLVIGKLPSVSDGWIPATLTQADSDIVIKIRNKNTLKYPSKSVSYETLDHENQVIVRKDGQILFSIKFKSGFDFDGWKNVIGDEKLMIDKKIARLHNLKGKEVRTFTQLLSPKQRLAIPIQFLDDSNEQPYKLFLRPNLTNFTPIPLIDNLSQFRKANPRSWLRSLNPQKNSKIVLSAHMETVTLPSSLSNTDAKQPTEEDSSRLKVLIVPWLVFQNALPYSLTARFVDGVNPPSLDDEFHLAPGEERGCPQVDEHHLIQFRINDFSPEYAGWSSMVLPYREDTTEFSKAASFWGEGQGKDDDSKQSLNKRFPKKKDILNFENINPTLPPLQLILERTNDSKTFLRCVVYSACWVYNYSDVALSLKGGRSLLDAQRVSSSANNPSYLLPPFELSDARPRGSTSSHLNGESSDFFPTLQTLEENSLVTPDLLPALIHVNNDLIRISGVLESDEDNRSPLLANQYQGYQNMKIIDITKLPDSEKKGIYLSRPRFNVKLTSSVLSCDFYFKRTREIRLVTVQVFRPDRPPFNRSFQVAIFPRFILYNSFPKELGMSVLFKENISASAAQTVQEIENIVEAEVEEIVDDDAEITGAKPKTISKGENEKRLECMDNPVAVPFHFSQRKSKFQQFTFSVEDKEKKTRTSWSGIIRLENKEASYCVLLRSVSGSASKESGALLVMVRLSSLSNGSMVVDFSPDSETRPSFKISNQSYSYFVECKQAATTRGGMIIGPNRQAPIGWDEPTKSAVVSLRTLKRLEGGKPTIDRWSAICCGYKTPEIVEDTLANGETEYFLPLSEWHSYALETVAEREPIHFFDKSDSLPVEGVVEESTLVLVVSENRSNVDEVFQGANHKCLVAFRIENGRNLNKLRDKSKISKHFNPYVVVSVNGHSKQSSTNKGDTWENEELFFELGTLPHSISFSLLNENVDEREVLAIAKVPIPKSLFVLAKKNDLAKTRTSVTFQVAEEEKFSEAFANELEYNEEQAKGKYAMEKVSEEEDQEEKQEQGEEEEGTKKGEQETIEPGSSITINSELWRNLETRDTLLQQAELKFASESIRSTKQRKSREEEFNSIFQKNPYKEFQEKVSKLEFTGDPNQGWVNLGPLFANDTSLGNDEEANMVTDKDEILQDERSPAIVEKSKLPSLKISMRIIRLPTERGLNLFLNGRKTEITFHMTSLGISLSNVTKRQEVAYICMQRANLQFSKTVSGTYFQATLGNLQIDNQLPNPVFPIILAPDLSLARKKAIESKKIDNSFLDIGFFVHETHPTVRFVETFRVSVHRLNLAIDEGFLGEIAGIFVRSNLDEGTYSENDMTRGETVGLVHYETRPRADVQESQVMFYLDTFEIRPIRLSINLDLEGGRNILEEDEAISSGIRLAMPLLTLEVRDLLLRISGIKKIGWFLSPSALKDIVSRHYIHQGLLNSGKILTSTNWAGNPLQAGKSVAYGFYFLVSEPVRGAYNENPVYGVLCGISSGSTALFASIATGFSETVHGISNTAVNAFNELNKATEYDITVKPMAQVVELTRDVSGSLALSAREITEEVVISEKPVVKAIRKSRDFGANGMLTKYGGGDTPASHFRLVQRASAKKIIRWYRKMKERRARERVHSLGNEVTELIEATRLTRTDSKVKKESRGCCQALYENLVGCCLAYGKAVREVREG